MKLLFCQNCCSIFELTSIIKYCRCKKSYGYYITISDAVYAGPCVPIGFQNDSFVKAVINQPENGNGKEFTSFVIPKECKTFKKLY